MSGTDALAVPPGTDAASLTRVLAGLHDDFLATGRIAPAIRPVVADSWRRSLTGGLDPETWGVAAPLAPAALEALRHRSPLVRSMPVIRRLLVDAATDAGLVVAVTDADGHLLWVEGNHGLRTRAEAMHFVEGADWSEASAGTNAPGTALCTGRPVQIFGPEHLMRPVTPWSCTAVPIRDPRTRSVLGALDVTGGPEVAGPQTLALVRATVAAVEAELRLDQLRGRTARPGRTRRTDAGTGSAPRPRLSLLGHRGAVLQQGSTTTTLSLRHSEIVALLAERPEGLTAGELAVALSAEDHPAVTVRAEMSRLRAVLGPLALDSRPYAFRGGFDSDVAEVRRELAAGRLHAAAAAYGGPLLPASVAPGVESLRDDLHRLVRRRLIASRDPDALLSFAQTRHGHDDREIWVAAGAALPPTSVRAAEVEAHVALLDARFG